MLQTSGSSRSNTDSPTSSSDHGTGVARLSSALTGAGSGTLLVSLAQSLPATNPYKSTLLLIAPSASVVLAGVGLWLYYHYLRWLFGRSIATILEELDSEYSDPTTASERKQEIETEKKDLAKKRNDLRRKDVERIESKIQNLQDKK